MRVIDDGRIGWLEALRVHPSARGRGLATQTQKAIIEQCKVVYPKLEHFRLTTSVLNIASQTIQKKCDVHTVYKQGFVIVSTGPAAKEFELQAMSPTAFKAKLTAVLAELSSASGAFVAPCDVESVFEFEDKCRSDVSKFGLNFDWKVALFSRQSLEKFLSYPEKPQLAALRYQDAQLAYEWVIGMTRSDMSKTNIRAFTAVTDPRRCREGKHTQVFKSAWGSGGVGALATDSKRALAY